jgi:hypothetical protein
MTSKDLPLPERVSNSFKQLTLAAADLNSASNELGQAISAIDAALQKLNLGVPTWVTFSSNDSEDHDFWHNDVGYAKVGTKWGIALRAVSGNYNWPDDAEVESWLFNEAPRRLRIEGIAKIPDLLEALIKVSEETTEKIRTKTTHAKQLAFAITQAASERK